MDAPLKEIKKKRLKEGMVVVFKKHKWVIINVTENHISLGVDVGKPGLYAFRKYWYDRGYLNPMSYGMVHKPLDIVGLFAKNISEIEVIPWFRANTKK